MIYIYMIKKLGITQSHINAQHDLAPNMGPGFDLEKEHINKKG